MYILHFALKIDVSWRFSALIPGHCVNVLVQCAPYIYVSGLRCVLSGYAARHLMINLAFGQLSGVYGSHGDALTSERKLHSAYAHFRMSFFRQRSSARARNILSLRWYFIFGAREQKLLRVRDCQIYAAPTQNVTVKFTF